MPKPPKILLFDIDGTLLLTGGVGRIAFERAFEELFGIRDAWGELIPDGKTDPVIVDEIATRVLNRTPNPEEYSKFCSAYSARFRAMIGEATNFRIMPGAVRLLDTLSKITDWYLGVQTGNFEEVAWLKLKRGNLNKYFSFGGFGSDCRTRTGLIQAAVERGQTKHRKKIPPHHIVVIGDAPQDIRAGRKLGNRTIAVTTGHASYDELHSCGPEFLIKDLSDIPQFLKLIG